MSVTLANLVGEESEKPCRQILVDTKIYTVTANPPLFVKEIEKFMPEILSRRVVLMSIKTDAENLKYRLVITEGKITQYELDPENKFEDFSDLYSASSSRCVDCLISERLGKTNTKELANFLIPELKGAWGKLVLNIAC